MKLVDLTERQAQVARGLARHQTHKEIGAELGISVSAVSKHVAALKLASGANTHAEIIEALYGRQAATSSSEVEKASWQDFHLPQTGAVPPEAVANDPGLLRFADGADYPINRGSLDAARGIAIEWPGLNEPQVVPRWLDGRNAGAARVSVFFGGMLASVASLVLLISAMQSLSSVVDGSEPDLALRNNAAK